MSQFCPIGNVGTDYNTNGYDIKKMRTFIIRSNSKPNDVGVCENWFEELLLKSKNLRWVIMRTNSKLYGIDMYGNLLLESKTGTFFYWDHELDLVHQIESDG